MTEPNETPLKPQLLPCPFCGTPEPKYRHNGPYPPEIAQTTTIECSNPDCRASIHRGWAPEPVIAAWNRRADPAPAPHNDATCQYAPVGNEFDWNKSDTTGLPLHDATGFFAAPAGRAGNTATLADSMNALMSFEPTPDIPTRHDILPAPAPAEERASLQQRVEQLGRDMAFFKPLGPTPQSQEEITRRAVQAADEIVEKVRSQMGDFRIQIEGVGGHGCQREVKSGEIKKDNCGNAGCPDCIAREATKRLIDSGNSVTSATIMHWPQAGPQIVDDLKTGKRTGNF